MDVNHFSGIDTFVIGQYARNMRELNDGFIRAAKQAGLKRWEAVCYVGITLEKDATPATILYAQESIRQRWRKVQA